MAPLGPSSPSRPSAIVSSSTPLHPDEPTPTDLLLATPPAILKLLTLTAPVLQALTFFVQLLTWTHPSFFSSLLVLLGWWTLCLFGRHLFLYGLNALVILYITAKYITSASSRHTSTHHRHRARPATLTPASYSTLLQSAQVLATHVHTLRATLIHPVAAHLSFVPLQAGKPAPAYTTAWIALTSYPFYLLLTFFVPLRFIWLTLGSVAILWNAPFFRTLRVGLRRSAAVRWAGRILLAILSGGEGLKHELGRTRKGVGIAGLLGKKEVGEKVEERPVKATEEGDEGDDVELLFTCMENQRWWVGLDWTHALLPGERASWTDPSQNPSSPPASFVLPPPSITYTPSPTKSDPNSRIKRTTEWKWLDPEWKVLRSTVSPSNISKPASTPLPPSPVASSSRSNNPLTTSSTLSNSNSSNSLPIPASTLPTSSDPSSLPLPTGDESIFQNWQVDEEGWQYGDNHWLALGAKGGIGKYTRRRAWVRRAGLVERAERVSGEKPATSISTTSSGNGSVNGGLRLSTSMPSSSSSGGGGVGLGVSSSRVGSLRERSDSRSRDREGKDRDSSRKRDSFIPSPATVAAEKVFSADMRRRKSSGSSSKMIIPTVASL